MSITDHNGGQLVFTFRNDSEETVMIVMNICSE